MDLKKIYKKYKLNRSKLVDMFLIDLFLALAIIVVYPFWKTGNLYSGLDMQFHLSRIQEWARDIQQGGIFSHPIIATHTFNEIGDVVPNMYPWVTLFPFALFMTFMKPVSAVYAGFTIIIFITLLLSYCSVFKVIRSKHIALNFSILYSLTTYMISETLGFEMGTALAYQFIPVAFVGLYMIMKKNYKKWYWLTLGLTGIMYSHALSAFIFLVFAFAIYVVYFTQQPKHERWQRFKYLVFSGIITLFLTVSVWYPIAHIIINQDLSTPNASKLTNGSGSLYTMLTMPLQNKGFNDGMGIFIIIIVILGFIALKKVPNSIHKYYYFGLLSLVIVSNIFPWGFISDIPILDDIDIMQKTSRLYPFSILLISIYGAYVLNSLCKFNRIKINKTAASVVLILLSVLIIDDYNESALYTAPNRNTNEPQLTYDANYSHQVPLALKGGYQVNNSTFDNQFPEENETGMTDYIPKVTMNKFGDIALRGTTLNHKHFYINQQDLTQRPNGMIYKLSMPMSKGTSLTLPFLKYKSLRYQIRFNGRRALPYKDKNGLLKIKIPMKVSKKAKILIKCHQPSYQILLTAITLITWLMLLSFIFRQHFNKQNVF